MTQAALAIDMGGSHIKLGIVDESGILAEDVLPVSIPTMAAVLAQLNATIRALLAKWKSDSRTITGIAVGICAMADGNSAVLAANGKYGDAVGFDFSAWSEKTFGLQCLVENDARLALLGEHYGGAVKGLDDAVLITLGTGIGGAAMLGGKLLRSRGYRAGGLAGHLVVAWDGRICSCGNRGCAEAEASTTALDAICRAREDFETSALASGVNNIDFRILFDAVDKGDGIAREVLDRCLRIWSALTVSLIHAYDPQIVVFGGGLMQRHESILPFIRDYVDRYAWIEKGSVSIVNSHLGSSAALFGALPLLRERV